MEEGASYFSAEMLWHAFLTAGMSLLFTIIFQNLNSRCKGCTSAESVRGVPQQVV